MLRILCPYCGVCDEPEFIFGGPGGVTRPGSEADDKAWTSYLYKRKNPAGVHLERWQHAYGCNRWINVLRDTRTHEILQTYPVGLPPPDPTDA